MTERRGRRKASDAETERAAEEAIAAAVEAIVEEEAAAERAAAERKAEPPKSAKAPAKPAEPPKPAEPTETPEEAVKRLLDRPRPRDRPSALVRFRNGPETVVVFVDLPSTLVEEMWGVWKGAGRDQTSLMALLAGSVSVKYVRYVKEVVLG